MKWITVILAAGILALNVTPLTELLVGPSCVEQSSCCSKKAAEEHEQNEKDCTQDVCNPFLSCCAPVLMIPVAQDMRVELFSFEVKHESFYQSLSGLLMECDVWQPPEFGV